MPESLYPASGASRRSMSSSSLSTTRRSILSSSECTIQVEDKPYYKEPDEFSITEHRSLALLPSSSSHSGEFYLNEHPVSYQFPIPPLTTISQLAYALGPDNTFHTTEIDTVPCAGIRIPQGPLTGLLAWRLVVRLAPLAKEKRGWWNENKDRRNSYAAPLVQTLRPRAQPYKGPPRIYNPSASMSTLSLPFLAQTLSPGAGSFKDPPQKFQPSSVILTRQARISKPHSQTTNRSQPQLAQTLPSLPSALTVNFILDTSLPYSIISRDALIALGYPPHLIPSPLMSHLAGMPQDNNNPAMVTLSIQNILTRFHIARPNEASKLGVQFLHDAGVSVFFPKDGEGVGPVLYVESARLLKDVPPTIPLHGIGAKLTLPQRVRALLGLS